MARKRIEEAVVLTSWEEVDRALKEIGECEIAITQIEGDMNKKINEIKEHSSTMAEIHMAKIAENEKLIKKFVTSNKSDIDGKTKILNFGSTGFRKSESVSIPRGEDKKKAIINSLRKNGMDDCIKVEESINKDILKKYNEDMIIRVGASLKKKDTFWYETNLENVK